MSDRESSPTPAADPVRGAIPGASTPPESHTPPPGARAMNVLRWTLFAGLLLLAALSVGSYLVSMRQAGTSAGAKKQARFYCPMHPTYTSDRPGECPICGMSLEPIPKGGIAATSAAGGNVPGLTTVHISPERVQLIGVRTALVEKGPGGSRLDLVGFVAPDESRLKRVQIRAAGWVQELFVSRTGETVATGQPLMTFYSPELYQSEQEYLIEAKAQAMRDTSRSDPHAAMGHDADGAAAALTRLTLLGVPPEEIARLSRVPVAIPRLTLRSTVNGTVLERNVTQGQYVAADVPLFTIADLSRVWVLADLYEMDFGRVRAGDRAVFTSDALPGRELQGRIEFVYPTVSSETRTLKVRLSLPNPDGALRPGMYGRVGVRVAGRGGASLTVPSEAVVNTGEHQYVFLARAGGHFEPRRVWTGTPDGDRVQILRGVTEGDTVVSSASFLIDSESRLKAAIAGMGKQPGAGHEH